VLKDQENKISAYLPIHDKIITGDACNLDPQLVRDMPINTAANFKVEMIDQENQENQSKRHFQLQLTKLKQPPIYDQVLRLISKDIKCKMEALEHNLQFLKFVLDSQKAPFSKEITPLSRVLSFNLISKVDGAYHPAFRAKKFIPWAFECLNEQKNFTHLLVDFELGSDTYQAFLEELNKCGGNKLEAIKRAYSHQIKTDLGFELHPEVCHCNNNGEKPTVFALYSRTDNKK
jgi:hypothetical protein